MQLTPEQEQRIQAVVRTGAYSSPEDALDAALASVETASAFEFEDDSGELDTLLAEGLASPKLTESEFWDSVDRETNQLLSSAKAGRRV